MRKLLLITAFYMVSGTAYAVPDLSALMRTMAQCETTEQCVVVEDICGGWTSVNKRNEGDLADLVAKIRPTASCPKMEATPKPAAAECSNNFCEVR